MKPEVDIFPLDALLHLVHIGAGVHPEKLHAHQITAANADHVENCAQQGQRQQAGQNLGRHQVFERLQRHGRRASICSVMFMMPISAVMALPARPVTISAESTGPSSRISESATAAPSIPSDPNFARV